MTPKRKRRTRPRPGKHSAGVQAPGVSATAAPGKFAGKLWSGRFVTGTHPLVEAFTQSFSVDCRLAQYDIQGSLAHSQALARAGVITKREARIMREGLMKIRGEFERGSFPVLPGDEDVHMAIERRLTELVGPVGGKLHTGRSRNDQIALDLRLYLRDVLADLMECLRQLELVLLDQAAANLDVVMPGYTHLQRAQPVLFAHHLLAYVEMLERDKGRLRDARDRANVMPLGSGALAGTNFPIDRAYTAKLLGFRALTENSLDAVADRDFAIEALAALSIVMMHLSRFSEELVLWASQEFRFVDIPDAFCTGSSMMPQKKNPDVPELIRGKTGRVYGDLMGLLATMKGLPLSYNRDLQEDKEPLFDALDTVGNSLGVLAELLRGLTVNREVLAKAAGSGYILATDLADYLAAKGVPFREAHEAVGRLVQYCLEDQKELRELSLGELRAFSESFEKDALDMLTVEGALERRAQVGGTARKRVERRIQALKKALI